MTDSSPLCDSSDMGEGTGIAVFPIAGGRCDDEWPQVSARYDLSDTSEISEISVMTDGTSDYDGSNVGMSRRSSLTSGRWSRPYSIIVSRKADFDTDWGKRS